VKNAISLVLLDDLIKKFPEGYSTLLGEKGFNLSGGEIVRIGIARAIIKKPDVIIIDEALSQVDSKTESIISGSIREIFRDKIVIIIAHRLSTIKKCDKIILLKDGKIAGIGKHKELFEKSIDYQELYKEQVIT
jgi:ABC-type multidrug transport system fused ATPase/permease subunit